jgi:predicted esterase
MPSRLFSQDRTKQLTSSSPTTMDSKITVAPLILSDVKWFWKYWAVLLLFGCGSKLPTQPDQTALLDALLNAPTSAEIATVTALFDRQVYAASPGGFEVLETRPGIFANLSLVRYHSAGLRIYGVMSQPKTAGIYPIILYSHGGDAGLSAEELDHPLSFAFVQLASSFRSEPVLWFGRQYVSEGAPGLWDGDVADALTLLAHADHISGADKSRVISLGGSRGGAVALLTAIRQPHSFWRVVDLFGPTDFFDPAFRDDLNNMATPNADGRTGVAFLKREIVDPYMAGDLSLEAARLALLQRSALYFAERLPPVQIHHGTADDIVPVSQSDRLADRLQKLNRPVEYFQYIGKGHEPFLSDELLTRILAFLNPVGTKPISAHSNRPS